MMSLAKVLAFDPDVPLTVRTALKTAVSTTSREERRAATCRAARGLQGSYDLGPADIRALLGVDSECAAA